MLGNVDIIIELDGRKDKKAEERVSFSVSKEVLEKIPFSKELKFKEKYASYVCTENLCNTWGTEEYKGFRTKTYRYYPKKKHNWSVLPQVLKDVKKLKKLLKKGLETKIYKPKTLKVSL